MEDLQLQIEKITGQADEKASCGVYSARVSFNDGSIGTLVSCILTRGGEEKDLSAFVKDIFDIAVKKLSASQTGSLEALKAASDSSRDLVNSSALDASFVNTLFYKNTEYVSRLGDRVKIFAYEMPKSLELTFENGSGPIKVGQLYLIATEQFQKSFDLSNFFEDNQINIEEAVDGLATEITAKEDQSEIGAALILVKSSGEISDTAGEKTDETNKTETAVVVEAEGEQSDNDEPSDVLDTSHEIAEKAEDEATTTLETGAKPSKFKKWPVVVGAVFREISKLRHGDIKAMFRLRRNVVAVGILIFIVLAGSAFFTLRGNVNREKLNEFNSQLLSASSKYEEGIAIIGLNRERARKILVEADDAVKKALAIAPEDDKAKELAGKISSKLKETEDLAKLDFKTVAETNSGVVSLSKSAKNLVAVTSDKIYEIDPSSGSKDETGGKSGAVGASVYDKNAFIFDGQNVYRVALANGKIEKVVEGEKAHDISVFLGNIYLLDADQIHKYTPYEGGYAKTVDYLNEKKQFDDASRLVIDGSIWVTNGSEVLEYLRGENQGFAISGLTASAGKFGEIYTDSDLANIYVVDSVNSALLVVDRDGVYKKTYQSSEFEKASGLVVDEESGKMYLAVGSKILEADL